MRSPIWRLVSPSPMSRSTVRSWSVSADSRLSPPTTGRPTDLLEHVARGPRPDRRGDRVLVGVAGEHEGAHAGDAGLELAADVRPVAVGQPHVDDDDVRPGGRGPGQG